MNATEYLKNVLTTESTPHFIRTFDDNKKLEEGGLDGLAEAAKHDRMLERLQHALWGISSEPGEVNDMFKKHLIYGAPFDRVNVVEEMGDTLWYVAIALDAIGISFETAFACNIAKLLVRYGGKFEKGRALVRDKAKERAAMEMIINGEAVMILSSAPGHVDGSFTAPEAVIDWKLVGPALERLKWLYNDLSFKAPELHDGTHASEMKSHIRSLANAFGYDLVEKP